MASLDSLPQELLLVIASRLPDYSLIMLILTTSRTWRVLRNLPRTPVYLACREAISLGETAVARCLVKTLGPRTAEHLLSTAPLRWLSNLCSRFCCPTLDEPARGITDWLLLPKKDDLWDNEPLRPGHSDLGPNIPRVELLGYGLAFIPHPVVEALYAVVADLLRITKPSVSACLGLLIALTPICPLLTEPVLDYLTDGPVLSARERNNFLYYVLHSSFFSIDAAVEAFVHTVKELTAHEHELLHEVVYSAFTPWEEIPGSYRQVTRTRLWRLVNESFPGYVSGGTLS